MSEGYADVNLYPVDERGMVYSYAFIGIKRLGAGQFYSISIRDKDGDSFDGAKIYRLNVPPNVPVEQYWSVTAYDRETHALIKNMSRASRSSQIPDMQKNADGSIDVYFGPKAPAGKETNWVPTDPARKFELMARFYGPSSSTRSGNCQTSKRLQLSKQAYVRLWPEPADEVGQSMSALPGYIRRQLVPLSRARHRPRCQGNGPCPQSSYGPAGVGRREGFRCAGRSG